MAVGGRLRILGGLSAAGSSLSTTSWLDTASGAVTTGGSLPTIVHDAAGAQIGSTSFVFGGGSPNTFATVQSLGTAAGAGSVTGQLPQPRSDLTAATVGRTVYLVGGYDGTTYQPSVLATVDGTHFTTAATLKVAVRYPAVVALGPDIFSFGGQTGSGAGSAVTATAAIQEIDPATHSVSVVGTLPQALYGAAAFVLDGHIYVVGGQTGDGQTLTQMYEFDQATHRVADAGLLPQAVAFAGSATVGTGKSAVGYLVGGEVAQQSGTDQAGVASGTLASVISLRPSWYGGPVGGAGAGAPFQGHLLHRRPGQRPAAGDRPGTQPAVAVPVGHHAAAAGRASTSPTTPSSSTREPGSSPTRRTTTPSSRSATRRGSSSGSTAIRCSPAAVPAT